MKKSQLFAIDLKTIRIPPRKTTITKCSSQTNFFTFSSNKRKKSTTHRSVDISCQEFQSIQQLCPEEIDEKAWKLPNSDARTTVTDLTSPQTTICFKKKQPTKKLRKFTVSNAAAGKTQYSGDSEKKQSYQFSKPLPTRIYKDSGRRITVEEFQVIAKLGEGSYSEVFSAREKRTGLICALKKLNKKRMLQQNLIEVLIREIKIHSHLNHKNILDLYGVFDDQDSIYMICEYCTNGDLFQMLRLNHKNCQQLELHEISELLRQICSAIESMHSDYLMHRDVKPENILLSMGNVVKVGDFGWSVFFGNQAMRNTQCGTPLYLAPELVGQKEYNQTVDIWAIGILAYQLLTGENPFEIRTTRDLHKVINQEIDFDCIEDEVARDFVRQLLEKNVSLRMDIQDVLDHPFLQQHAQ